MIVYTEKGAGLHLAIHAAGHELREENGAWITDDDVAVQAIIDGYTIDQAKAFKQAEILALAKSLRDRVIRAISAGEMASWPVKLAEAAAYAKDPNASCPMLSAEAAARGITLAELVAKVGGNATTFSALEAQIGGIDGRHRDAIKACATFAEVAAYDFSTGWPTV